MPPLNRRLFLQQSAVLASWITAPGLLKIPSFAPAFFAGESSMATTKYGKVRGYTDDGINVFKGIPYGADTSKTRFIPPLPPENWSGIKDTVEYAPSCPQQSRNEEKKSEDCLYLNVFTPSLRGNIKRPSCFTFMEVPIPTAPVPAHYTVEYVYANGEM